ncbi:MAG: class I SAM-dependent methyltransferase, partial [Candidatus Eisenbacteria bacterium]|nr:class I SAM-dependent methyltransferase [Candidatus Eisenbacteria bacterium]
DTLGTSVPRLDYGFCAEHGRTYEIRRCANCTHLFAIVTARDLWKNYQDVVDVAYLDRAEERALTFRKLVARIRGFVPSGRLLDIGCATDDFLDAARAHFDVEGVELSKWSSQIAIGRGFRVHTAGLGSIQGEGLYDVATLWGVIGLFEHVDEEVARITRLLRPGGVVCIWTGDMDSWLAKALGRRYWYVMGQYLQLFTKRSLCTLFERHGYERRWMGTYPFTSNFRLIGNSLGRYRVMGTAAKALLHHTPLSRMGITLLLPGEMFAVFRKAG